MIIQEITSDMAQQQSAEELWATLATSSQGLSSDEAQKPSGPIWPECPGRKKG